jgi:hypothetical protein
MVRRTPDHGHKNEGDDDLVGKKEKAGIARRRFKPFKKFKPFKPSESE